MDLPKDYTPSKHLKDMIRRDHNKVVARYFRDLGPDWQPNLKTPRDQLRTACHITDDDTMVMVQTRLYYFYDVLGYGRSGLAQIFGSTEKFEPSATGHPKVVFYFSQDAQSATNGKRLEAELSFRLMGETESTFTPQKAKPLAARVLKLFVQGNKGITLNKDKTCYCYSDVENGFKRSKVYASTRGDAVDMIRRLTEAADVTFDQDKLTTSNPERDNTVKPKKKTVYGKQRSEPAFKPKGTVRFRYCYVELPSMGEPIFLVDTTYKYSSILYP